MKIKLNSKEKFFIKGPEGNLILVDSLDIDPNMIKNDFIALQGTMFYVDYEDGTIDKSKYKHEVQLSFQIENIGELDEEE